MIETDQFYRDLELVLECDPGTINGSQQLSTLNWDSLAILGFIAMADQKYSVTVPVAHVVESSTVADLLITIRRSQV